MDESELRRLRLRSWRRGMRENDLLLGSFADARLATLGADDLVTYAALLEENDQDIYAWIVAASAGEPTGPARYRRLIGMVAEEARTGAKMRNI